MELFAIGLEDELQIWKPLPSELNLAATALRYVVLSTPLDTSSNPFSPESTSDTADCPSPPKSQLSSAVANAVKGWLVGVGVVVTATVGVAGPVVVVYVERLDVVIIVVVVIVVVVVVI